MIETHHDRDRGISITVTHVLTIGLATILIALLLMGASTMLESERHRSTESSLETIGERLARDIGAVDRAAVTLTDEVTVTADQPDRAGNAMYTVTLHEAGVCGTAPLLDGSNPCLKLTAQGSDAVAYVPLEVDAGVQDGSSAPGGEIEIVYDTNTIRIRSENA